MKEITSLSAMDSETMDFHSVTAKTFGLDIRLVLNKNTVINLEMQVLNKGFWPERSINYLARSFDNLNRGDDYLYTKSAIHIGFLDFDLPDIPPEFYSTYKLLNVKNRSKYSDKFTLSVVNLKHIDLATEEDKKYHIDKWAALFKATTWEEIKMITGNDEYLGVASSELFRLCAADAVRAECEARERYYREQQYFNNRIDELEKNLNQKDTIIFQKDEVISKNAQTIHALNAKIQKLEKLLEQNH